MLQSILMLISLLGGSPTGTPSGGNAPAAQTPPAARAAIVVRSGEVVIYNGGSPKTTVKTKWGAWGGGDVNAVENVLYDLDAKESLHVVTLDYFQGVHLDIDGPPIDLTPYRERGYLILRMRFPDVLPTGSGVGGFGGGSGGGGSGGSGSGSEDEELQPFGGAGGLGGGAGPGGAGPGGPGGGGGLGGGAGTTAPAANGLVFMRVTLFLEKGAIGVGRFEVDFDDTDEFGWTAVRIPFNKLRPTRGAAGGLKRIAIGGDAEDEFHLGQVKLVQDVEDMRLRILVNGKPAGEKMENGKRIYELAFIEDEEAIIDADVTAGNSDPDLYWVLNREAKWPVQRGIRLKQIFNDAGQFDGWVQIEDMRRGDERKEPWRYLLRINVKKPN